MAYKLIYIVASSSLEGNSYGTDAQHWANQDSFREQRRDDRFTHQDRVKAFYSYSSAGSKYHR